MLRKKVPFLLLFLISSFMFYGQLDSISYYKQQIKISRAAPNFSLKKIQHIDHLNTLSSYYKHINTDTIAVLANEALEFSESIGYEKGKFESLSHLAVYELINGNIQKSLTYNKEILKQLDVLQFPTLGANVHNVLAETYFRLGNYPETYRHGHQSLFLAEQTKNKNLIRKFNSNLGTLFSFLGDYDEAVNFYTLALNGFDKDEESLVKSGIMANLGYLYMKKKDYSKALELLNQSMPILKEANITEMLMEVNLAYGTVYFENKEIDKALSYFETANAYYKTSNNIMNKALSFYGLGTAHLGLNNFTEAGKYLNSSLDLYQTINFKTGLEETYKTLYELSKKQKNTDRSLYFLELSEQYADSNFFEKNSRDISMLKAKIAFEEDKADLKLKNDLEVAEQKNYVQRTIFGLVCALVIALLVFQANRTEKKLNKELAIQTDILTQKQKELNEINKNQDKLFSIVGHDLRGPIVSLKQLLALALENETGIQHFYRFGPKLKKDVDHIHFTLDNLLNWGLTQMQGEPLKPVTVNVKEELIKILDLFRETVDKKSITIHKDLLESEWITMDANHFKIIFRNLISNAIKFTQPTGEILLKTQKEDNKLVISIKDNGIGMSKETLERIFDQKDYYTTFGTDNERGTGLGLVLCSEMIAKNKGTISVTSVPNQGSTFYVRFSLSNS